MKSKSASMSLEVSIADPVWCQPRIFRQLSARVLKMPPLTEDSWVVTVV
jgi:hypothetical protein